MLHNPTDHEFEFAGVHDAAQAGDENFKQVDMHPFQSAPAFVPSAPPAPSPRRFATLVDRVGATASMLCAAQRPNQCLDSRGTCPVILPLASDTRFHDGTRHQT